MNRIFFRSAAIWTALGLIGGLGYREVTRANDFVGTTQLAVVHTHALVLGTVFFLLLLVLARVNLIGDGRAARALAPVWNVGLALTVGGLTVKGFGQVIGADWATSPAIAGVSGLGHITLTVALVLLFVAIRAALAVESTSPRLAAAEVQA